MDHFIINGHPHEAGIGRCSECYAGYPMKCTCGGLIHADFISETWEGQKKLAFNCDKCHDKYVFPIRNIPKKIFTQRRKPNRRR